MKLWDMRMSLTIRPLDARCNLQLYYENVSTQLSYRVNRLVQFR